MDEKMTNGRASAVDEAADWYVRLKSPDVSELDAVRFRAWLAGDPERRREFEALDSMWQGMGKLEAAPEV
ncbi:FecR/PupR family sigma factor regulator, partial [Steroidobacter sp.]|uniref:FecR/PupR family sigma factor regulator n=1 Tax=Steroidobacter sp. TaxID=1978227 RepID=UPI001A4AF8CB